MEYNIMLRVKDVPKDYELVSDSQDIEATIDSFECSERTKRKYKDEFGCLLVLVGDGFYQTVYGVFDSIPYKNSEVRKLKV